MQTLPDTEQIHQIDKSRGAVGTCVCVPDTYFPSLGRPELIDSVHYFSRPRNLFGGGFPKSKKVLGGVGQKPKKFQVGSPPPPEKNGRGVPCFPSSVFDVNVYFFRTGIIILQQGYTPLLKTFWRGPPKSEKISGWGPGFLKKKLGGVMLPGRFAELRPTGLEKRKRPCSIAESFVRMKRCLVQSSSIYTECTRRTRDYSS